MPPPSAPPPPPTRRPGRLAWQRHAGAPPALAPLVDQVIMVVEAGRTQRAELGASLELLKACPNVILVLNKVKLTHRHSFGSYYYFGYPS